MSKRTRLTRITQREVERHIEVLEEEAAGADEIDQRVQEIRQRARYILDHLSDYQREQAEAKAYFATHPDQR